MDTILKYLIKELDWDVKEQVQRRYGALLSQYEFLRDANDKNLRHTFRYGWNDQKYKVLFAFNAFYQVVLGPLTCSAYGLSSSGLGSEIPIRYGSSLVIEPQRNASVKKADNDFASLLSEFGFSPYWVSANRSSDITYAIAKRIREERQGE